MAALAKGRLQPTRSDRATRRDDDYGLHDEQIVPLRVVHCDARKRR